MLKLRYTVLGLLLSGLLGIISAGGAAAADLRGQAPAAAAENIELVATAGGALGQTVVVHNPGFYDLAYTAVGSKLQVLDLSGSQVQVVGQSVNLPGVVGRIIIRNDQAYVAAGAGFYIFRITIKYNPLRVTLEQTGSYGTKCLSDGNFVLTDFTVAGNFAYALFSKGTVFGAGSYFLEVINISDPAQPTLTGELKNDGPATAIAKSGNRVYIAENLELTVVDVSDPANPGTAGYCNNCLSAPSKMAVVGGRAYVINFSSPQLRVFNLADPDHPVLLTSYENAALGPITDISVAAPYAYVTFAEGGLRVLDPGNQFAEVAAYDTSNDVHGSHLSGRGVTLDGDDAYVNIGNNSLHKVDIAHTGSLSGAVISEFALSAPVSVKVLSGYAYVAGSAGLNIVRITDKNNPQLIGRWSKSGLLDVDVQGDYAYLLSDFNLYVLDISTPATPRQIGSYQDPSGGFSRVTAADSYVYVMAEGRGLLTFSVANPVAPALVSATPYQFDGRPINLSRAYVRGTTLYAASNYNLCRVNIADPTHPMLLNSVDVPGYARNINLNRHPNGIEYVYLAAEGELDQWGDYSDGGMRILRSDNLGEVGYFPTVPLTKRVAKQVYADAYDGYVIEDEDLGTPTLPNYVHTLRMTDLHDFNDMTTEGYYQLPGKPGYFAAQDGYIYIPVPGYGLMLLRPVPHTSLILAAAAGGTLVSDSDHTTYTFSPGTFPEATKITHTVLATDKIQPTGNLNFIHHAGRVTAVNTVNQQAVAPTQTYDLTVHYTDEELGLTREESLAIYFWDGAQWLKEPGSSVNTSTNTVTANPDHFSQWAVLGEKVQLEQKLYFPHIASDATWETEICVINTSSSQSMRGIFTAYSNNGVITSTLAGITLPPHGRRSVTVGSEFTDPDKIGYIIFSADSATFVGYTKFYITGKYRVAVPALSQVNTGDLLISHIASTKDWWTGVSLLNPTASAKTVNIIFNNGATATKTIAAGEHTAFRIRDLLDSRPHPEIASAVIDNAAGIIGLELFGNQNQLSGILLKDDTTTSLYFAHLASNDVWWTGICAYNPHPDACTLRISPYRADGEALTTRTLALGSHEKYLGTVAGLDLPEGSAWFTIGADAGITGFELFGTTDGNLLAGYTGVGIAARKAVFPKIDNEGWTGIAFANIAAEPANIDLTYYNDAGVAVAQGRIQVGGHCKVGAIAEDLLAVDTTGDSLPVVDTRGSTYLNYTADRDVVGFQINGSNDNMLLDALPGM